MMAVGKKLTMKRSGVSTGKKEEKNMLLKPWLTRIVGAAYFSNKDLGMANFFLCFL